MDDEIWLFKNGHWTWDDDTNCLHFVSSEDSDDRLQIKGNAQSAFLLIATVNKDIQYIFNESVEIPQELFKKFIMRKVKNNRPDVVTLQDVKDIAIYTCNASYLSKHFINFFHTKAMDSYLRSLIVYFQYYLQEWNKMELKREEEMRKVRTPYTTILENDIRDNISDLRCMVARDYSMLLMGCGDAKHFHHLNRKSNMSLLLTDRQLYEMLSMMAKRVVWITLLRQNQSIISEELDRILRTDTFNITQHLTNNGDFHPNCYEKRVLEGLALRIERKLLQKSPAILELLSNLHDYRMLVIGISDCQRSDPRLSYLNVAYTAPEELLDELQVPLGILGVPRRYMEVFLTPKEVSATKSRHSTMKIISEFTIPPYSEECFKDLPEVSAVKSPSKYTESSAVASHRVCQRKLWAKYIKTNGQYFLNRGGNSDNAIR